MADETPDPIITQSLSSYYLAASLLLLASMGWALYDEFYGLRPWKDYQRRFIETYSAWLKKNTPKQNASQKAIEQSETYRQLDEAVKAAERDAAPQLKKVEEALRELALRKAVVDELFKDARGRSGALTYAMETATGSRRESLKSQIEKLKKGPFEAELPGEGSSRSEKASYDYAQLESEYSRLKDRKSELQAQAAELQKPANEQRQKRDVYLQEQMVGLNRQQMLGLQEKMSTFKVGIKQINVPDGNLVDRCESCHLGLREPVVLTRRDVGPKARDGSGHSEGSRAFTSHPTPELLKIHDPERFGCSPCHNGNGRAVSSVEKAHGRYEHWLWPLFRRENMEAGCNQCHSAGLVLKYANVLNEGKELFRWKGCMGCHRMEGFDAEPERLFTTQQTIRQLEQERAQADRNAGRMEKLADTTSASEAMRLNQQAENLHVSVSRIDAHLEQLDLQAKNLLQEIKKVGPSLKEVRSKLRKEWIPAWIENPQEFRPGAKMPRFRLHQDEIQAISAFIWQSGANGTLPHQPPGNPANGKELLETRGCLACHSIGEDAEKMGGTFAANLTRVGEKVNYDYLVRWIHNPRERTLPYCPYEKKDIGPQDYAKHGVPFVFDPDHTKCPNDGHELQIQQMTVMPRLRLSVQETRDIASYLMTRKRQEPASYAAAPYLEDPRLKARGLQLVRNYGCAGCHEITGMEEEGRIGTELTNEGSKPIERLDFALLTRDAEDGIDPDSKKDAKPGPSWYNHKGFFEHKLKQPNIFDQGRSRTHLEELRMPDFSLQKNEIRALATFLLGAVDPTIPPQFFYRPADQRRDIEEGWWIIKKYNCQGCHVVEIGQRSVLMDLPRYQEADWKEQLPPRLTSEGARVSPDWLIRFLKNPNMSETDTERNGVRQYLKVRMPTFTFSDGEIRKLVRFFAAVSYQPELYIQAKLDQLTPQEQTMARQLFTSKEAPCLKCHATGNPAHDKNATAPNFLLARERLKPGWTGRWMVDPARISPGTSMPSGLFKREGDRWVFNGVTPASFKGYLGDHVQLLVRYMFQFTPEEQRRLGAAGSSGAGAGK